MYKIVPINLLNVCMRIIEWFRPFPKTFFSGLGKIENKRLEQKQIYDQKQFF